MLFFFTFVVEFWCGGPLARHASYSARVTLRAQCSIVCYTFSTMQKFFRLFFRIAWSYVSSLAEAIRDNEFTQEFQERYPRFFKFLQRRLSPSGYLGLHLTIGFFFVVYFTLQFIALTRSLFRHSELVQIDTNIITFITTVRTGALIRPMLFFTALANWPTILLLFLFFATFWIWRKRWFLAWMFFLTIAGSELLAVLMKILINRERPDPSAALLIETSASFPSGHALIALSFYGFLAYAFARARRSLFARAVIVCSALALITAIGVSRIYLGVHWPSDILGGYILALFLLVIIATAADMYYRFFGERRRHEKNFFPFRWILFPLAIFGGLALVYVVAFVERPHFSPSAVHRHIDFVGVPQNTSLDAVVLDALPNASEGLTGRDLEPLSIMMVGDGPHVRQALSEAGWFSAEVITLRTSFDVLLRSLKDRPYPTAPVSPAFVFGRPQDGAWQKATENNSARERHHVRLWRDQAHRINGQELWVGTASFDAGVKLTPRVRFPTHRIAPAIDAERDFLVQDLERVGAVAQKELIQRYDPYLGTNALGDQFFTDGKVVILYIQ